MMRDELFNGRKKGVDHYRKGMEKTHGWTGAFFKDPITPVNLKKEKKKENK